MSYVGESPFSNCYLLSFCYDHIQGLMGGIYHTLEEHFLG